MTAPQDAAPAVPVDPKPVYRRALAGKVLLDLMESEKAAAAGDAEQLMADLEAERVPVKDEAGTKLGTITRTDGRTTAVVVDEPAFVAWMARKHPGEVYQAVREATKRRLLSDIAKAGDPVDTLAGDGELVPGVEIRKGRPYVSIRPEAEARERMAALLANSGLLQLTAGEGTSNAQ